MCVLSLRRRKTRATTQRHSNMIPDIEDDIRICLFALPGLPSNCTRTSRQNDGVFNYYRMRNHCIQSYYGFVILRPDRSDDQHTEGTSQLDVVDARVVQAKTSTIYQAMQYFMYCSSIEMLKSIAEHALFLVNHMYCS